MVFHCGTRWAWFWWRLVFMSIIRSPPACPSVTDFQQRASQFETTRISTANGRMWDVLYEILDPASGRRTYIPLTQISPALVAGDDCHRRQGISNTHGGFDPLAICAGLLAKFKKRRNKSRGHRPLPNNWRAPCY